MVGTILRRSSPSRHPRRRLQLLEKGTVCDGEDFKPFNAEIEIVISTGIQFWRILPIWWAPRWRGSMNPMAPMACY
jgi:hypothetical protein